MTGYLEITIDKFTFRVATDRRYTDGGVWAFLTEPRTDRDHIRVGLSDYLQQRSGDAAFVSVKPIGTTVAAGEEFAEMETIKVTFGLPSPVSGKIVEVNRDLEMHPELVNEDAYGKGWLAVIEAANREAESAGLLEPQAYLDVMRAQARRELEQ
jgi:glycine cleavage system H protein